MQGCWKWRQEHWRLRLCGSLLTSIQCQPKKGTLHF